MADIEWPCGCKLDVTFTKTCKEHTQRLLKHIVGDRTIDLDDIEYLFEKEAQISG